MNDELNLGTCCECGTLKGVRNILMLNFKGAPGKGWGCFQCGLPMDGASAVLCDQCLDSVTREKRDPKLICVGYAGDGIRAPFPKERIPHDHDMALHPEVAA